MVHTKHFIEQRQAQSEDVCHVSRNVKHPFTISAAGIFSSLARTKPSTDHNHQWITHSPPTTLPPLMTTKIESGLQSMLYVLAPSHSTVLGINSRSPTSPFQITTMVANLHPSLMNASSCSATHRRQLSLSGAYGAATWGTH